MVSQSDERNYTDKTDALKALDSILSGVRHELRDLSRRGNSDWVRERSLYFREALEGELSREGIYLASKFDAAFKYRAITSILISLEQIHFLLGEERRWPVREKALHIRRNYVGAISRANLSSLRELTTKADELNMKVMDLYNIVRYKEDK